MASFAPFVAPAVLSGGADLTVALPDPPRAPGEAITRPGVARHAGATLVWLQLGPQGGPPFELLAPVTGTCRLLPALPALSAARILELSPLPFASAPVLRRLPGLPTFYLAPVTAAALPEEDALVRAGSQIVAAASTAFVGLLFDDRVALSPAAWVELIAAAMSALDSATDVTAWRTLARFATGGRALRVLDHVGRPAAGQQIRVAGPSATTTLTTDATGALPLPAGALSLTWQAARPVHALYER